MLRMRMSKFMRISVRIRSSDTPLLISELRMQYKILLVTDYAEASFDNRWVRMDDSSTYQCSYIIIIIIIRK